MDACMVCTEIIVTIADLSKKSKGGWLATPSFCLKLHIPQHFPDLDAAILDIIDRLEA